jgi:hypothetical protein
LPPITPASLERASLLIPAGRFQLAVLLPELIDTVAADASVTKAYRLSSVYCHLVGLAMLGAEASASCGCGRVQRVRESDVAAYLPVLKALAYWVMMASQAVWGKPVVQLCEFGWSTLIGPI